MTRGQKRLHLVTAGYKRLRVKRGYKGLQRVRRDITDNLFSEENILRRIQGIISGDRALQGFTGGYRDLQGVTRSYMVLQSVIRGYTGFERITENLFSN